MTPDNEGATPAAQSEPATPTSTPAEEPVNLNAPSPPDPGEADAEEFEDLEYDGDKLAVPKSKAQKFRDALLRQADYTRKTQEVAARNLALNEKEQSLDQQAKAVVEHRQDLGQLAAAEAQLAQYGNVDWQAYFDQDPIEANKAWVHQQQLKEFKGSLETKLKTKERERATAAQQETVKRLQETAAYAQKNIKGWTPELDVQIEQYANETFGFTREELLQLVNPKTYRALHQAWLYGQLQSNPQPAQNAPAAVVQPLQTVAPRTSPGAKKPLAQVNDMDEYVRRRKAGEKG